MGSPPKGLDFPFRLSNVPDKIRLERVMPPIGLFAVRSDSSRDQ